MRIADCNKIRDYLIEFEESNDIKILFAAEAGSRAWGFPSDDSDYDIRFIYVRPTKSMLSLNVPDDNMQCTDVIINGCGEDLQLDLAGWDLDKSLGLLTKSNAALMEWLESPYIYSGSHYFVNQAKFYAEQFFDVKALVHHYANMAYRCRTEHLKTPTVRLKKYFYSIRPLLAADYALAHGSLPPVDFDRLFAASKLPEQVRLRIENLLKRKRSSTSEQDKEPADLLLLEWIDAGITRTRTIATQFTSKKNRQQSLESLDEFYYQQVIENDRVKLLEFLA